jgi:hypothetical protein
MYMCKAWLTDGRTESPLVHGFKIELGEIPPHTYAASIATRGKTFDSRKDGSHQEEPSQGCRPGEAF